MNDDLALFLDTATQHDIWCYQEALAPHPALAQRALRRWAVGQGQKGDGDGR